MNYKNLSWWIIGVFGFYLGTLIPDNILNILIGIVLSIALIYAFIITVFLDKNKEKVE